MGDLAQVRTVQARIHTLRGHPEAVADWLDWLETTARDSANPEAMVDGLATVAAAHAALGHQERAVALLVEVDSAPGSHSGDVFIATLPTMVRTALALNRPDLTERLVTGTKARHPLTAHALATANAAIAEHQRNYIGAATNYAEVAGRWEQFDVIPERAFAMLGQGRCLVSLGRNTDAETVLHQSRSIFDQLRAAPSLSEIDLLLRQATAPNP
jgi:hypothetical protein